MGLEDTYSMMKVLQSEVNEYIYSAMFMESLDIGGSLWFRIMAITFI